MRPNPPSGGGKHGYVNRAQSWSTGAGTGGLVWQERWQVKGDS